VESSVKIVDKHVARPVGERTPPDSQYGEIRACSGDFLPVDVALPPRNVDSSQEH
jgi:hypothetical protein